MKYSLQMRIKEEGKIDDIAQDHVHSLINWFFLDSKDYEIKCCGIYANFCHTLMYFRV